MNIQRYNLLLDDDGLNPMKDPGGRFAEFYECDLELAKANAKLRHLKEVCESIAVSPIEGVTSETALIMRAMAQQGLMAIK